MLNSKLEANHAEVIELGFKLDLMESQLVRKMHKITSAQQLTNKMKLVLGFDDPAFKILF